MRILSNLEGIRSIKGEGSFHGKLLKEPRDEVVWLFNRNSHYIK